MKIGIPKDGRFGEFGGKYIPETLAPAIEELEKNYLKIRNDKNFKKELGRLLIDYAGRPTPIYFARNLTKTIGGAKIYLKREDLLHGGAHKINNTLGQALLAKRMGKKRIIAETGAGQGDYLKVYEKLRELNPSPYMFHLKMKDDTIIGSSPEMLLRVTGRDIETFPIAGTRKITNDEEKNEKLKIELLNLCNTKCDCACSFKNCICNFRN